jgi:hypothetical protein
MTANKVLAFARSQIGVKESPANSNNVIYNTKYYGKAVSGSSYPWCVVFVWWIFSACGAAKLFYGEAKTASCNVLMLWAKKYGLWVTSDYRPGDLVVYNWSGGTAPKHIGIIESVSDDTITAIEGNTAVGNDSNGGEVMRRTRDIKYVIGAVRPEYEREPETEDEMVRYNKLSDIPNDYGFRDIINTLMDAKIINGDGSDSSGNDDVIDLSHDQVRTLVFIYRGGGFDKKLEESGLKPVVK